MFQPNKAPHKTATRESPKHATECTFYILLKVKFLGQEKRNNRTKSIKPTKIEAIKGKPSPREEIFYAILRQ